MWDNNGGMGPGSGGIKPRRGGYHRRPCGRHEKGSFSHTSYLIRVLYVCLFAEVCWGHCFRSVA